MNTIDFHFDRSQTYTFWSGLIGGLFLHLSYFGCDQSQVQRYLTAKSVDQARHSLLMSAFVKIPLQALVLLIGVLMFVFYVFNQPPMLFNPAHGEGRAERARGRLPALETEFTKAFDSAGGRDHDGDAPRGPRTTPRASSSAPRPPRCRRPRPRGAVVKDVTGDANYGDKTGDTPKPDVNYVFPTFVTTRLPMGLVGLIIAAIFAAAMSAIAGELNATATASVIDVYKRLLNKSESDAHYLLVLAAGGRLLGHLRLHRRPRRGAAGLADRGRQPLRLVLLRIAARRVRAGADRSPRQRPRRVHRSARAASCSSWPSRSIPRPGTSRSSGTTRSAWWS